MKRSIGKVHAEVDPAPSAILVIGYGNELRRDDGLGPRIARAVESEQWSGVRVITAHQLTPELAEPISRAETVIFIDATLDGAAAVQIRPLSGTMRAGVRSHFMGPLVLLDLAGQLYDSSPKAWWMTLPAFDLSFGEGLSGPAEALIKPALNALKEQFCSGPGSERRGSSDRD